MELMATQSEKNRQRGKKADQRAYVSTCAMSCDGDRLFHVVADGNVFGPFKRIVVSPMIDPETRAQMVFDIKTFAPVQF